MKKRIEQNGKEAALSYCRDYLGREPGDNTNLYYQTLLDYYYLAEDPARLIVDLQQGIKKLSEPVYKGTVYLYLAEVYELTGQLNKARQSYHNASLLLTGNEQETALVNSTRLFYELGFYADAWLELDRIPSTTANREILVIRDTLRALLSIQKKDNRTAEAYFERVLKDYADTDYYTTALYHYIVYLRDVGKSDYAETLSEKMNKNFPSSPETALLANSSQILRMPVPNALLSAAEQKTVFSTPGPPLQTEDSIISRETDTLAPAEIKPDNGIETIIKTITYIQAGSFTVKENAEYLQEDLNKKGFKTKLGEKTLENKLYHVVLVEPVDSSRDLDSLLNELKAAGFNGFKVTLSVP